MTEQTPVLSVVYSSTATTPFSDSDLFELLEHSRDNNARDGLTGMLLYRNGRFLQVLEGPEDAVRRRIGVIRGDGRHTGFQVLIEEKAAERQFPDWTMGFAADATAVAAPGYLESFAAIDAREEGAEGAKGAEAGGEAGTDPEAEAVEAGLRELIAWFEDPANHAA